jgi:catalase
MTIWEEIVDGMNAIHGAHPGFRAAHAKGVVFTGTFTPSPNAAALCRAPHLQGDPVDVTVRFSNGAGDPTLPDADRRDGKGLAVKFHLPGGEATDLVFVSIPVFLVRDEQSFLDFLKARAPDPETGEMDMEKVGAYLAEHPETAAALQLVLPALAPRRSYATTAYNSLHAFRLTNADGESRWIRYRWVPEAGEDQLSEEEIESAVGDYLQKEIVERVAEGPVAFELVARLAEDGDPLEDPTLPWPEERDTVSLGRLEVTESIEEPTDPPLINDPNNLCDGIEASEDRILAARSHAYSVSIDRRLAAAAPPP